MLSPGLSWLAVRAVRWTFRRRGPGLPPPIFNTWTVLRGISEDVAVIAVSAMWPSVPPNVMLNTWPWADASCAVTVTVPPAAPMFARFVRAVWMSGARAAYGRAVVVRFWPPWLNV